MRPATPSPQFKVVVANPKQVRQADALRHLHCPRAEGSSRIGASGRRSHALALSLRPCLVTMSAQSSATSPVRKSAAGQRCGIAVQRLFEPGSDGIIETVCVKCRWVVDEVVAGSIRAGTFQEGARTGRRYECLEYRQMVCLVWRLFRPRLLLGR